jgi:hypothetical protein
VRGRISELMPSKGAILSAVHLSTDDSLNVRIKTRWSGGKVDDARKYAVGFAAFERRLQDQHADAPHASIPAASSKVKSPPIYLFGTHKIRHGYQLAHHEGAGH